MIRPICVVLSAALLGSCAHSSLLLLPDEDGSQGAVAVLETNGQPAAAIVSQPNSRTTLGQQNKTRALSRKGLTAKERMLLAGMPAPARSFSLYFLQGTTELTPPSRAVLTALRAEIASRTGADVDVTGHTDTVGGQADNDVLSRKRAEEVLAVLSQQGIDRSLMSAVGRGERELRELTPDGVSNAANRRVEVIVR